MNKDTARRSIAVLVIISSAVAALSWAQQPAGTGNQPGSPGQSGAPAAGHTPPNYNAPPTQQQGEGLPTITEILDGSSSSTRVISGKDKGGKSIASSVGLNGKLGIVLSKPPAAAADRYVLFLNDSEVKGLAPATYTTFTDALQRTTPALVFQLTRGKDEKDNDAFWRGLLGSPWASHVAVNVSLGQPSDDCKPGQAGCQPSQIRIRGAEGALNAATFQFQVYSGTWLLIALGAVVLVLFLVWGHARTRTTLRDALLPQLAPNLQPYSLGRWQMAFWFVLIFASFIFLYILLWDYNTVSDQALALMGIAAATGLASVAVDAYKDSPADKANRGLQALGLNSYDDVLRLKQELADREKELTAKKQALALEPPVPASPGQPPPGPSPTAQRVAQLQLEIQDRNNILKIYDDKTRPFLTQGWFKDITTDLNGTAIHRLQVVCWTIALGLVFLVGVYRDLAMPPDFSATLLALMGISSAGYVGFKFPEQNN